MKKLSDRLKQAMQASGVRSQNELARLSGVQQSIISKILSGKNETSKFSNKLALALGISADWLINGVGSMHGGSHTELEAVNVTKMVDVWDANGKTGDKFTWPESLPKSFRAYVMPKNTGIAEAPLNAVVIVNPDVKPQNNDLVVTSIAGSLSTYRFLEGPDVIGFLGVDDPRIPLSEVTDPSVILGVAEQIFVRSLRK